MFCPKCGNQVQDGSSKCPKCGHEFSAGSSFDKVKNSANQMFDKAENELRSAIKDVNQSVSGNQGAPFAGERLKDDRSLLSYIVLSLVTCGIYGYYFLYKMAHDVNIACEGDGENTAGLVKFVLLSLVTCGIYAWFWYYNLGNRLASNAPRYGMSFQENGTTVLLWQIFGAALCGIGPFVAMNILIKNSNKICRAYNQQHGMM